MTRRRTSLILAAAVLTIAPLAACGATHAPLNVGVRDIATTLLLGSGGIATAQAPLPPVVVPVTSKPTKPAPPAAAPGFTPPAAAPVTVAAPSPTTSAPQGSCPALSPLAVPAYGASPSVLDPPTAASYVESMVGGVQKGDASVALPATAKWSITNVTPDWTGSVSFDQVVVAGDTTTTSTYRIVPQANTAPNLTSGAPVTPGMYLVSVAPAGLPTFRLPDPGILLAGFPFIPGSSVTSTASAGPVTMSFTATVKGRTTLNACGTPVDSWEIDLTSGKITNSTIAGADGTQTFTASYFVGTQFGGIVLATTQQVAGSDGGVPVHRTLNTALTTAPTLATDAMPTPCQPPVSATSPPVQAAAPAVPSGTIPVGTFAYRSNSLIGVNNQTPVRLPWVADRTVSVAPGSSALDTTYTITRTSVYGSTATTFRVVSPGTTTGVPPGIYIEGYAADGATTFTAPAPGLLLAALPLVANAAVTSSGSDGAVTVSFTATVSAHAHVPVGTCDGSNVDSWEIDVNSTDTIPFVTPIPGWPPAPAAGPSPSPTPTTGATSSAASSPTSPSASPSPSGTPAPPPPVLLPASTVADVTYLIGTEFGGLVLGYTDYRQTTLTAPGVTKTLFREQGSDTIIAVPGGTSP